MSILVKNALLERLDLRAIPGLKGPVGILENLENPEKPGITTALARLGHLDREESLDLQAHMVHWGTVEKF